MHVLSYLSSHMADDLTEAVARLQHVTHEPWTVDWQRFGLVCGHGVLLNHWHVLTASAAVLAGLIADRHAVTRAPRSRRCLQECHQRQSELPSGTGSRKTLFHSLVEPPSSQAPAVTSRRPS